MKLRFVLFVICIGLFSSSGVFAQVFPDREFLMEVSTTDGSVIVGSIVAADEAIDHVIDEARGGDPSVSVPPGYRLTIEIYGGSRFVVQTDRVQTMRRRRNLDFQEIPQEIEIPHDRLARALAGESIGPEELGSQRDGERQTTGPWWRSDLDGPVYLPTIQIAGGTVAVAGYTVGFFDRRVQLSALAGLGLANGAKLALAQQVTWNVIRRRVVPRVSGYAVEVTDGSKIAVAAGPSIGVAVNFSGRISSVYFDNAFTFNLNPWIPRYVVYMPSIGVTF